MREFGPLFAALTSLGLVAACAKYFAFGERLALVLPIAAGLAVYIAVSLLFPPPPNRNR